MEITVQLVRKHYWNARFRHHPGIVGEGRTSKEAIGHLILLASDQATMHGGPSVTRLPDGELSKNLAGK